MKLRFTIRDLLWLAIVVALLVVVWIQGVSNRELGRKNSDLSRDAKEFQSAFSEVRRELSSTTRQLNAAKAAKNNSSFP